MTAALVVGAGVVGTHATLQLAATATIDEVLVADQDPDRATAVAGEAGSHVRPIAWSGPDSAPNDLDVIVCALPAPLDVEMAAVALARCIPLVSCADRPGAVRRLLEMDAAARQSGVVLVAGAGLAPGLAEVLAAFGVAGLDEVDEVHVARYGSTGTACLRSTRRSTRERPRELDEGRWVERGRRTGRKLVYFPAPVGPRECRTIASAVPELVQRTLPDVRRITSRTALTSSRLVGLRWRPAKWLRGLAALHVEVRGRQGDEWVTRSYGAVDQSASASGAVLATATTMAAGLVDGVQPAPGVWALAQLAEPGAVLAELARRGVRTARFDGRDGQGSAPKKY